METIQERVFACRAKAKELAAEVKALMNDPCYSELESHAGQHGEMKANTMLTYRHLEDAGMRLGKVIQAFDNGVSVYQK